MLRLRVCHDFLIAVLIGENDEQVLAVEISLDFIGQVFLCILVGNRTLSSSHNDEKMVVGEAVCQLRKGVPLFHVAVIGTHLRVSVLDIFIHQGKRIRASVELNAAIQVARYTCQALQPAVETGFKFGP